MKKNSKLIAYLEGDGLMMDHRNCHRCREFDGASAYGNHRQSRKPPANCISCYRLEEKLSLQKLARILGVTSHSSIRDLCESLCPSAKYIQILALREELSVSEFRIRYAPVRLDAA